MDSTALATRDASPRVIARYLASLKPVLGSATDARNVWVRYLGEIARRDNMGDAHTEAVQFALARGQQFHEARRAIMAAPVPPGYETMHQAVDGWLQGLLASCEYMVRSHPPLDRDTLERIQDILREAGTKADKFNAQRQAAVQTIVDSQSPVPARARKMVASKKEMRALVLALVAALLLVGGSAYAFSTLAAGPTPTRTPTPAVKPNGVNGTNRQVYTPPDVLAKLKAEIANRKVAWLEPDVKFVVPDRVIITGKIQGPVNIVPVEVNLQVGVTDDGKPLISAKGLSAVGVEVPTGAFDALNKRIDEANQTLPQQLPPGQTVKRIYVEDPNSLIVELSGGPAPAANGTPAAATTPAAQGAVPATKPGA